jgi:L,D-transpeptidase YbiS
MRVTMAAGAIPVLALAWIIRCLILSAEPWAPSEPVIGSRDEAAPGASLSALRAEGARLREALARKRPSGKYLVIDSTNNMLWIRDENREIRRALCSTGSRIRLTESAGGRRWEFRTPRGAFRVREKLRDPLWKKPDWAFVEESRPVPEDPGLRFESGALGAYALHIGDGYLIHGTLYERLLGRSVTHGCVRLGREDLDQVYDACQVGTPVYIF